MLTPEEFYLKMKQTITDTDDNPELYHPLMDEIMADLLKEMGYEKGIELFNSVSLWYA